MSAIPELLAANRRYVERFDRADLPKEPARRVAILTCMDARLVPSRFLGLEEGDAHVISNAGGRATEDALRSLIISYKLLGTQEMLVIHHSDCGAMSVDNRALWERLRRETGADASEIDFLPFRDLDASVREDVAAIRDSPLIPLTIQVRGFVYDVATGALREVD
ncbi:MAG: beta-class carbonic anhydrase [Thermoanaerobaculia bacterium]